jgi:hypothetical protein
MKCMKKPNAADPEDMDVNPRVRCGVPVLPSRGEVISPELVQQFLDEEGV